MSPSDELSSPGAILVTGCTGYIGGRLVPRLLQAGHRVRVLVRNAARLEGRPWRARVEVVEGDLSESGSLEGAFTDLRAAYYLVHPWVASEDFERIAYTRAQNFALAAQGRLQHCISLSGLVPHSGEPQSRHFRSRAEVGRILAGSLPLTEFRAGPIIGSGSASFEMVRYLTERLPVMVAPNWVRNPLQPIDVDAVLAYLEAAQQLGPQGVVNIGGEELSFREMMLGYAKLRGLRRTIVPLPVSATRLAALWVSMVTPISNSLAGPLVEALASPVHADTARARALFPKIEPRSYLEAVRLAVLRTREGSVETRWTDASGGYNWVALRDREGAVREDRSTFVPAPPEQVFAAFSSIGGDRGWMVWGGLWRLRGAFDRLIGGPGLSRGRRHPNELVPGEALDFWRVERVEPGRRLVLCAEMKLPGKAWLMWEVRPVEGGSQLVQSALFVPRGLAGFLYWYAMYPAHRFIFSDLCHAIARDAVERHLQKGSGIPSTVEGPS